MTQANKQLTKSKASHFTFLHYTHFFANKVVVCLKIVNDTDVLAKSLITVPIAQISKCSIGQDMSGKESNQT